MSLSNFRHFPTLFRKSSLQNEIDECKFIKIKCLSDKINLFLKIIIFFFHCVSITGLADSIIVIKKFIPAFKLVDFDIFTYIFYMK